MPPTIDPILLPEIQDIGIPDSSSTFNTPIWANPKAAPPERAKPILTGGESTIGFVDAVKTISKLQTIMNFNG
jgi:hypothetical protein